MAIKACLFDMGNVLVHFSHKKMCQNIAEVCGCSIEKCRQILFENGLQQRIETGQISEAEFHREFEIAVNHAVPFEKLKDAAANIFDLNIEIVPLLQQLKDGGMKLVLLSNTSVTHANFIRQRFDVLNFFDECTLSYEVGAMKPAEQIYADAVRKAGCSANECFYTDDIADYVHAAQQFGIRAVVFTDTSQLRLDMTTAGIL